MADTLDVLERSTQKTHEWLNDFAVELGVAGEEREAYRLLRGFLHTLRDRLTVGEAVDLAAQLPVFLRGVFYDGWVPDRVPQTYDDVGTFLRRISEHGQLGRRDP